MSRPNERPNKPEMDEASDSTPLLPRTEGRYPKHVFFILGNEFCERYSYYGMRTILVLYLKYYMLLSDDSSTAIYHAFTVFAYFFPIIGALVADSWLGKYRTILYLSMVYVVGMILNTMGAVPTIGNLTTHLALTSTGLIVIAIGTGGIKPCVSTFGGDQFEEHQTAYRETFFSLFYFSINAGSLMSTIISPILRENVHCLGRNDCYALAFGVPAILMAIALITFSIGTPYYRIKPPEGNVFVAVCKGIKNAIVNRWRTPPQSRDKDHWMDYATPPSSRKLVRDTKYVLNVLVLYLPLPFFWALFDQQGSRWTLQATRMNGYFGSSDVRVKPDQMQAMNPLFIVTLIPLTEVTLYRFLRRRNIRFSQLRRMTLGMVLAGVAFVVAAFVQMRMEKTMTIVPELNSQASFRVINAAECRVQITSDIYPNWTAAKGGLVLDQWESSGTLSRFVDSSKIGRQVTVQYGCVNGTRHNTTVKLTPKSTWDLVVSGNNSTMRQKVFQGIFKKSSSGGAIIRVFNALKKNISVAGLPKYQNVTPNNISVKWDVERHSYQIKISDAATGTVLARTSYYLDTGGIYTLVVSEMQPRNATQAMIATAFYIDSKPNDISLFWMIPQYFLITLGEVFLSVTGLEFSYSQAPTSMRSVLTSFWLLTDSIGNIITLIVAESKMVASQSSEYFLFAGLMAAATIIFVVLASRYEYVDEDELRKTENLPLESTDALPNISER